ncbi:MAG: peptidoglycan DD-metalloendopeptidase family protein [Sphingomicrobium sp.]
MRASHFLIVPLALLLGAPAPSPIIDDPLPPTVKQAAADYAAARARADKFQDAADRAVGALERLRAEQRAAASDLESAEARITLADVRLQQTGTAARKQRAALAEAQRPAASLLAGMAIMSERPPLLALMDEGSVDALVRTRVLMDSTLPVIRARSGAFAARLAKAAQAVGRARSARSELEASRAALSNKRTVYAAIEQRLLAEAERAGSAAVAAADRMLASRETSERLGSDYRGSDAIRRQATELASGLGMPPRPGSSDGPLFRAPFVYRLPASAPLTQGLGEVDRAGVRARGITLGTARGSLLESPAAGTVRFAGPVRGFDGVLILDHGGGWMTMLVNLSPQLRRGQRVAPGDPIGRALGPISVELYRNGKAQSPALIAGSSPPLSNAKKGG